MTQLIAQSSLAYAQIGGWGVKTIVAELHAARNRWRAAQQAGVATIPAIVRETADEAWQAASKLIEHISDETIAAALSPSTEPKFPWPSHNM